MLGKIFNGLTGNFNEVPLDTLNKDYGAFLINGEQIEVGYKLIRDAVIFTNIRIIFIDKQGTTGVKTRYTSIFLSNVIDVEMESAGFGIDDSELNIYYLTNVKLKGYTEHVSQIKLEFPKKVDIVPLYKYLFELAYNNRTAINS